MNSNKWIGIGMIRVSGASQLKGYTVETQKNAINRLCEEHSINLVGVKKFLTTTGRKSESIEEYMGEIKRLIKVHNANCLVLWRTNRLGRLLPELYTNTKDLIDNYVKAIFTTHLIITEDSFKSFNTRCILYMNFMMDEAEGYSIYERMFEGRKTKEKLNEVY